MGLPRELGEEGKEGLVAVAVEFTLLVQHPYRFVSEAERNHELGFLLVDFRILEETLIGFLHVGRLRGGQLLFHRGNQLFDVIAKGISSAKPAMPMVM